MHFSYFLVNILNVQRINDIDTINMNEKLDPYQSDNTQTLGELFIGFLEYFSHFQ